MLVELRSTGAQTVFPGSIHETGEVIEWSNDGDPTLVNADALVHIVQRIAAGTALVPFWGEGARHELSLALAGALLRAGWNATEAGDFIEGVAQTAGDKEAHKRRADVESTAQKLAARDLVVGLPKLSELLGDKTTVQALVKWLRLSKITPAATAGLPAINASTRSLSIVTSAAWDALAAANVPPRFFQYATSSVRLERGGMGRLGVEPMSEYILRYEAARAARWFQYKKDPTTGELTEVDAFPSLDVIRDMLATPSESRPLPPLTRIVEAPVFSPMGELVTEPGYHAPGRVYYDPPAGLALPSIPVRPTAAQIAAARSLILDDLLGDFPFAGDAERAHALALLLLPFVRDLIDGYTPLHMIEAPTPGSGKGLLADVLLLPALGSSAQVMSPANDNDEWRKRITSSLSTAPGAIQIDNVARVLDSPDLAAVLTMPEWSDRALGTNRIIKYPVRSVWLCTGNNIAVGTDMARRMVRIRLNPAQDRPWERQTSAFRKPDLKRWALDTRGPLVAAALILVRAWLAEGRPQGTKTLGSFAEWARLMGGILNVAGVPGFLGNMHELYETADTEGTTLRAFVDAWWAAFASQEVSASDLFPVAEALDGLDLGRGGERSQRIILGKKLGTMRDRVFGDYRVARVGVSHRLARWQLQPPQGPSGPTPTSPPPSPSTSPAGSKDATTTPVYVGYVGVCSGTQSTREIITHTETTQSTRYKAGAGTYTNIPHIHREAGEDSMFIGSDTAAPEPRLTCLYCDKVTPGGIACEEHRGGMTPPVAPSLAPRVASTTITVGASYPDLPVWTLATVDDVQRTLPALLAARMVGFDTETTGLDPLTDRLRLIQLATHDGAYVLDAGRVDPRVLAPLFDAPVGVGPLMIAQNAAFDLRFLHQVGLATPAAGRLFDTELVARLLSASAFKKGYAPVKHGLAAIARRVLGLSLDKTAQTSDWAGELTEEQLRYAALDAVVLPLIAERLQAELVAGGLERVAALEMEALPAVAWLMETGVPFDSDGWQRLARLAEQDVARVEQDLTLLAATGGLFANGQSTVKWSSTQQVAALLRERGHAAVTSTEEAVLRQLADEREPLAPLLLRHREASKRASTYGLDYLKHVHPLTGRIHASFRQLGSEAGRMSAADPNVQQIPRDKAYRACVRPGPGRVLVKADYAQIELRLAAQIAPDERLVEAFQRGDDLHTVTARRVLGKTDVTKADRQAAKAVNFGLLYGMGAKGLRQYAAEEYGVHWTEQEAQTVRGRFFAEYRGLQAWHRSQIDGEVETRTVAGRRRLGVERYTEKLNTPVQGSGADGLKAALGILWETRHRVPGAAPILVVHDEIVVECDREQADEARDWVVDAMRTGMETVLHRVPAEVEATICTDWSGAELHISNGTAPREGV